MNFNKQKKNSHRQDKQPLPRAYLSITLSSCRGRTRDVPSSREWTRCECMLLSLQTSSFIFPFNINDGGLSRYFCFLIFPFSLLLCGCSTVPDERHGDSETDSSVKKGNEIAAIKRKTRPSLNSLAILKEAGQSIDTSSLDKLCDQLHAGVFLKPNKLASSIPISLHLIWHHAWNIITETVLNVS